MPILSGPRGTPQLGKRVFIAPDAQVIDLVKTGDDVTILFGCVLRGDILPIEIGNCTNIQEHTVIHTSKGRTPSVIGSGVTVGHRALIHGARVEDRVLIGMGSILLDEAVISEECVVGAGSLVTEGKRFPPRSLIIGSPAKAVRTLSEAEIKFLTESAERYVKVGSEYHQRGVDLPGTWQD
jgi:carbonic anhydrase/acetyltransferase-like protein (isoleucine patch superfamily)